MENKKKAISILLWGCVLILISYLAFGCAIIKPISGTSAQIQPENIPFKNVVNVPLDWPDITKYEFVFEPLDISDEIKGWGFLHYIDRESYTDYVFTVIVKGDVVGAEIIHLGGLYHFYWIYNNNFPSPKACTENEIMEHFQVIIDKDKKSGI